MSDTSTSPASAGKLVLFAGNPNAGKTTLFNLLTGARAKVGNYPGVTVDKRTAKLSLPGDKPVTAVDLPGCYSLTARSGEERVAIDAILARGEGAAACIVIVVDATTLGRGLYFAGQILEMPVRAVVALTMMDEARRAGIEIDIDELAAELRCPVVPLVATKREGREDLLRAISGLLEDETLPARPLLPMNDVRADIAAVEDSLASSGFVPRGDASGDEPGTVDRRLRARAIWALLSLGDDELESIPEAVRNSVDARREAAAKDGRNLEREIIAARYAWVDRVRGATVSLPERATKPITTRIDDVLVHPVWGLVVFAAVMFLVFQALFAWAEPFMSLIEHGVDALKGFAKATLPPGAFTDLLADGVISGVGNVVVFVPQIAILFVFITILEDSGYLARVAFVIDRIMAKVGLNGRAFVPMLSGFACAIPAVMATRTIESRRDRLLTMLVIPLSSCSARLPVYVLMTSVVFDRDAKIGGVLSQGAVALFAMYVLSVFASLGAAFVLGRTALKGSRPTLVLELPPYRWPRATNIVRATSQRVRRFLVDAGTVILSLTIILWALLHYPKDDASEARFAGMRDEVGTQTADDEPARTERLAEIDAEQAGERLRNSAAGRLGRGMEPVLEPLGFDWKIGVGLIGAFAAREVFVSTLGLVYDVPDADEANRGLQAKLRAAKHPDGSPVFTPLAGIALMIFFVLACQCMSTLAVVRRESGSWKWAGFMFAYMTSLAYVVTLIVYQTGKALGVGLS